MSKQKNFFTNLSSIFILILFSLVFLGNKSMASNLNSKNNEIQQIEKDRHYLDKLDSQEKIIQEIKNLENQIASLEADHLTSKTGIKIYSGKNGSRHNILSTKLHNRKNKLKNPRAVYNSKGHYLEDRGSIKEYNVDGYYSQEDMNKMLKASLEVLDNLKLDQSFLKTTNFVISPYRIKSSNGYAVVRSNNQNTIIISHRHLDKADFQDRVKATVLHEIGHIFYSQDPVLRAAMPNLSQDSNIEAASWENSKLEAVAEEFRILTSTRLGNKSFPAYPSKTKAKLSKSEMDHLVKMLNK